MECTVLMDMQRRNIARAPVLSARWVIPAAVCFIALSGSLMTLPPPAARAAIEAIGINVCTRGMLVAVYGNEAGYAAVTYSVADRSGRLNYIWSYERSDGSWIDFYFAEFQMPIPHSVPGRLFISYPEGASAMREFIAYEDCRHVSQSQIRGMAYEDVNRNGLYDRGEPALPHAYYKLTDGGNWFVCGFTDGDGLYRVPVDPGAYYIFPVAPPGYRPVAPRIATRVVFGSSNFAVDMGFVRDPGAPLETCDLYNPPRGGDMPVVFIGLE